MKASSVDRQELEQVSAEETPRLDRITSFLEVGQTRPNALISDSRKTYITVIGQNALARTCLTRCLKASDPDFITNAYQDPAQWYLARAHRPGATVLLCATGQKSTQMAVHQDLGTVVEAAPDADVIIVSDFEDPSEIAHALKTGAKGYISMNSDVDIAIAAIRLIKAGGIFVPASSLLSLRPTPATLLEQNPDEQPQGPFTQRELDVVAYLRQGVPNKLIAYKLGMGECTVKVHVRNVMRKLKAKSRTEIAFLTNDLFDGRAGLTPP